MLRGSCLEQSSRAKALYACEIETLDVDKRSAHYMTDYTILTSGGECRSHALRILPSPQDQVSIRTVPARCPYEAYGHCAPYSGAAVQLAGHALVRAVFQPTSGV